MVWLVECLIPKIFATELLNCCPALVLQQSASPKPSAIRRCGEPQTAGGMATQPISLTSSISPFFLGVMVSSRSLVNLAADFQLVPNSATAWQAHRTRFFPLKLFLWFVKMHALTKLKPSPQIAKWTTYKRKAIDNIDIGLLGNFRLSKWLC